MNHALFGNANKTDRLLEITKPGFLLIDDGPIADAFLENFPRAKLFDPSQHSFNPLREINYKRARVFSETVYTASPQGENTLTVRNGKRALTRLLLNTTRLDKLHASTDPGDIEAQATIDDLLLSTVLKRVLCNPTNFSFKGSVVAKIDRAELGDFDAFILASFLVAQSQQQVVVPDFGFYGRDFYTNLIRQERLTVCITSLSELSPKLQQSVLTVKNKSINGVNRDDAERLIFYTKHPQGNPTDLMDGEHLAS